jgi:lycopene cyclase domain-containing protein
LQFHLVFTIPPIVVLWVILFFRHRSFLKEMLPGILLIAVIAVAYTTPWDNYLVYRAVWGYGSERVLGTIGYVPVEEYAFFVLQTVLTGLLLTWGLAGSSARPKRAMPRIAKPVVAILLLATAILGGLALLTEPTLYLGLILAWAFPVLLMQWLIRPPAIWDSGRVWIPVVAAATIYLGIADSIAIASGTWYISERYTTGIFVLGLPLEEALFFLVTNLLVVWGLLLYRSFRFTSAHPKP